MIVCSKSLAITMLGSLLLPWLRNHMRINYFFSKNSPDLIVRATTMIKVSF